MYTKFRGLIAAAVVTLALVASYHFYERGRTRLVTIAAGPEDGEAFAVAHAIAEVTERYNRGIEIVVLETRGSGQNMELLQQGQVQMAAVLADSRAVPSARLIAPLYPDAFQLVARDGLEIESVADLRGRKIALPPRGAGQYNSFWFLAEHYRLSASEMEALPMSTDAANFAMLVGAVDAVFRVRAPGNSSIRSLIENSPTRLVPIDQAAAMQLKQPALDLGTIPKGSYRGHPPLPAADLPTAVVQRLLVASADVDGSTVNTITRTLFERRRDLVALTPLAGFIAAPEQAAGTFLPIHPGAQRYYDREKPSYLQQNAEPIAVIITVLVLVGSGLLQLASQRRRGRLDTYNRDLLLLYNEAQETDDQERLLEHRRKLMGVLGKVVDDAEEGRITAEGFNIFSFTWDVVNSAVRDKLALTERRAGAPRGAAD